MNGIIKVVNELRSSKLELITRHVCETYADQTKEPPKKRNRNKFIDDLKDSLKERTYFHYPTFFNKLPEMNQ